MQILASLILKFTTGTSRTVKRQIFLQIFSYKNLKSNKNQKNLAKMAIHKESLSDLKENFQKAEKLVNEENLVDPAEEPYKSLYEAAVIFLALENKVELLLKDCKEAEDILIYSTILGHIYLNLGEKLREWPNLT